MGRKRWSASSGIVLYVTGTFKREYNCWCSNGKRESIFLRGPCGVKCKICHLRVSEYCGRS